MTDDTIKVGQLGIKYIVDGSSTETMGVFELTVPPGSNVPPPHSHSKNEECVYVIEGVLRYTVGSETRDLAVGQCMTTPRGVVHAFSNPFASTARAVIVQSPDIGAQYFRDIAAVVRPVDVRPHVVEPQRVARAAALPLHHHHVTGTDASLPNGEQRSFLEDGDTVILRAHCARPGFRRIGFGDCAGTIVPAV